MAAGEGFKTFSTGDVLTAADVNGYLMQGVWVFADASERTSEVTSPQEGNMSYLKDTNSLEYYSGSAWVAVGGGLTSPLTTKGDIWTYSTTNARLGVGSNNQVLTADSAQATGLKWATPAASGLVPIAPTSTANSSGSVSTSGSTVTASGVTSVSLNGVFSSTYTNYRVVGFISSSGADQALGLRFRASGTDNTSSNYNFVRAYVLGRSTQSDTISQEEGFAQSNFKIMDINTTGTMWFTLDLYRPFEAATTTILNNTCVVKGTNTELLFAPSGGQHNVATSYDGITFMLNSGSSTWTGNFTVYGYTI